MTRGCVIFAHNGDIDYGSQAVLSAKLAIKYLKVPVSLISDAQTILDTQSKFGVLPFDRIIEVPAPIKNNQRRLNGEIKEFNNGNRSSVWNLTPYDRTLVIDSDFLIFSDELSKYWDDPCEFLITPGMMNLQESTIAATEYPISPYSINMLWATNIMFTKNSSTKILFDLVEYIRQEYRYYAELYDFDRSQYRNDFAFSIACHIMSAHGLDQWQGDLPIPLFFLDTAEIIDIKENGQITFLSKDLTKLNNYLVIRSKDQDVHIMNKQSILDNIDRLLELADD